MFGKILDRLLQNGLSELIRSGQLSVVTASGRTLVFGDGSGAPLRVRFTDALAQWGFMTDPELKLGELYTDGRLLPEQGSIYDFLALVLGNVRAAPQVRPNLLARAANRLRFSTRRLRQRNTARRAKSNVAHHYDLGDALYSLFLDDDWQYSCAYFETPGQSLEQAQLAKKRHIAAKLLLQPGQRVLDIGCGWGGLALYLAQTAGAGSVLGITLSEEQLARARRRAAESALDGKVEFRLTDYRDLDDSFDRIVSVGMFEHVGLAYYDAYFQHCRRLLRPDGVMLLHTIGCTGVPSQANPWLDKYIFPGGYLPTLSELTPAIERSGLMVTDIEVLRLHYAETLLHWRQRFMQRRDEAVKLYDEKFCRLWEFYLAFCEAAFRYEDVVVFQVQLSVKTETAPLTRNYIAEREQALRSLE